MSALLQTFREGLTASCVGSVGEPGALVLQNSIYPNIFLTYKSAMKKYICILASAALLAACEHKTETTEPAASPSETSPAETTTIPTPESPSPSPSY